MKRHRLEWTGSAYNQIQEMQEVDDGEWVDADEALARVAELETALLAARSALADVFQTAHSGLEETTLVREEGATDDN